jgi:hypothetical protein
MSRLLKMGTHRGKWVLYMDPYFLMIFCTFFIQENVDIILQVVCKIFELCSVSAPIGCKHLGKYSF